MEGRSHQPVSILGTVTFQCLLVIVNILPNITHQRTEPSQHLQVVLLPLWRVWTIVLARHLNEAPLIWGSELGRGGGTGAHVVANDGVEMRVSALEYVGRDLNAINDESRLRGWSAQK